MAFITRKDLMLLIGSVATIAVLAIIGAIWVVVQAVGLLMPVLILIDGR